MAELVQVLRDEITNDPLARGYSSMSTTQRTTSLNTANRPTTRDVIPAYEVIEATVPAEWAALTAAEKQRYQTIVGAGQVNARGANTRAAFLAMFGVGTQTRTNLAALQDGSLVSRATELGLPVITDSLLRNAGVSNG